MGSKPLIDVASYSFPFELGLGRTLSKSSSLMTELQSLHKMQYMYMVINVGFISFLV